MWCQKYVVVSFVEWVHQGESLVNWFNWLTEPPTVCWSVIMGDFSPSCKRVHWTRPEALRTGPPNCPVQGMNKRLSKQSWGWWYETPLGPLWRHCNEFIVWDGFHAGGTPELVVVVDTPNQQCNITILCQITLPWTRLTFQWNLYVCAWQCYVPCCNDSGGGVMEWPVLSPGPPFTNMV